MRHPAVTYDFDAFLDLSYLEQHSPNAASDFAREMTTVRWSSSEGLNRGQYNGPVSDLFAHSTLPSSPSSPDSLINDNPVNLLDCALDEPQNSVLQQSLSTLGPHEAPENAPSSTHVHRDNPLSSAGPPWLAEGSLLSRTAMSAPPQANIDQPSSSPLPVRDRPQAPRDTLTTLKLTPAQPQAHPKANKRRLQPNRHNALATDKANYFVSM